MSITAPRKRIKRNWWEHGSGRQAARWWTPQRYWTLLAGIEQGRSDGWIAQQLGTTREAVRLARKRAGLSSRVPGVLNSREVALMLGIGCSKTIARWIDEGWLWAYRGRANGQHRRWHITVNALQAFLANPDHWHRWDAARITDPDLAAWAQAIEKPRYLTTGEVGRRLCVQHTTVQAWIARGILPAVRNGNWLVPEPALEIFIAPGQVARTPRPITDEDRVRIRQERSDGKSLSEICRLLGRNYSVVFRQIQQFEERASS